MADYHRYDPLQISLDRQLALLLANEPAQYFIRDDQRLVLRHNREGSRILTMLSQLLVIPQLTDLIEDLFRPLILDLCARWLECQEGEESIFLALAYLLAWHPEIFPILQEFSNRKTLQGGPLMSFNPPHSSSVLKVQEAQHLQELLVAYYRILWTSPALPDECCWPIHLLASLFASDTAHPDRAVRYLAIRCYSIQTRMGEARRNILLEKSLGTICAEDIILKLESHLSREVCFVDGWAFPYLEVRRIEEHMEKGVQADQFYGSSDRCIQPVDLSNRISNIEGILLMRSQSTCRSPCETILTPPIKEALRELALVYSLGLPPLLSSERASGKSTVVNHLAHCLLPLSKRQVVSLHMADTSLDPRSLYGSYSSSTKVPGQFQWKDGVLVQAMKEGRWILLRDVDKASSDVMGVVLPLIESCSFPKRAGSRPYLDVPSHGRVYARDSFAIFSTRSCQPDSHGKLPPPSFMGCKKFSEIVLSAPERDDLLCLLDQKFPRLAGVVNFTLISIWLDIKMSLSNLKHQGFIFRHLEKLARRADGLLASAPSPVACPGKESTIASMFPNPSIREEMLVEVRDVFFGSLETNALGHAAVADALLSTAANLELSPEAAKSLMLGRCPAFEIEKDTNGNLVAVLIGRHRLTPRVLTNRPSLSQSRPFVFHRPALDLLSRLATCLQHAEPVLITGETGSGKTSLIAHLADLLQQPLLSLNLSLQTESSDLLGGLKPDDTRRSASELLNQFISLFDASFSRRKNPQFEKALKDAVHSQKWKRAVTLWREAIKMAMLREREDLGDQASVVTKHSDFGRAAKKSKKGHPRTISSWIEFETRVSEFEVHHVRNQGRLAFSFLEGPLVKAVRDGQWVLLDEINLANSEVLESIASLLDSATSSMTLVESGSMEPIPRHPNFKIFACMNPATDVGKKDLPVNIRSRFTEFCVESPDSNINTLQSIIKGYIAGFAVSDQSATLDLAEFYIAVKRMAEDRMLADGSNRRPHYSIRTLCRALTFVQDFTGSLGLRRSLWEGCLMTFATSLDNPSLEVLKNIAIRHLLRDIKHPSAFLSKALPIPTASGLTGAVGPFHLTLGPLPPVLPGDYILTPSVQSKISTLARAIAFHRSPILIEGPTSSGKTSSIEYIARRTGHHFVRINNHEHTDISEYLGSYQSDHESGKLTYTDGILVKALRRGHWLVLDELNLAPSDVLEALNRLLDDNRQLVIPETQEVIEPHSNFMLFATQNPHGLYAGRKLLSRALRNRFLEFYFDDMPEVELETVVCERCGIAPSFAKKIVTVFRELQRRRQAGRIFESKESFATLRDVFRWAFRKADSVQRLAEDGFMLLAERARHDADKAMVKEVIESVMNVRLFEDTLYALGNLSENQLRTWLGCSMPHESRVAWTQAMQRLFALVALAMRQGEPVLLVGEPGSGKTTACELVSQAMSTKLSTLSCHQNTETADMIGGMRPIRNRITRLEHLRQELRSLLGNEVPDTDDIRALLSFLRKAVANDLGRRNSMQLTNLMQLLKELQGLFEWQDGPLVQAMRGGHIFLLDEISLVDDSVLERLNSVLEPERRLTIAENSSAKDGDETITASPGFHIIATMNPGGDFGKKELSPALRNRFTEIWVPTVCNTQDMLQIVNSMWSDSQLSFYAQPMVQFGSWASEMMQDATALSLRDMLSWAHFMDTIFSSRKDISIDSLFHHGAEMAFLDGVRTRPQLAHHSLEAMNHLKLQCENQLQHLVPLPTDFSTPMLHELVNNEDVFGVGPFRITKYKGATQANSFDFRSGTTRINTLRILRACQLSRPVLLEGNPGVGKTTLVAALARSTGRTFYRINLSDQTDLTDLFGTDLPADGGGVADFQWQDAEFIKAMQCGSWVLLDEMNLAPQAVLEGLNAVFDHRGRVYVPELDRSFYCHPEFRVFAAQNPAHQGGGRKGLPKSFVDRFTKVYVEPMDAPDIQTILVSQFPTIVGEHSSAMIKYCVTLQDEIGIRRLFAQDGSPWEFNLRDTLRLAQLTTTPCGFEEHGSYEDHLEAIFLRRLRSSPDREKAAMTYSALSSSAQFPSHCLWASVNEHYAQIGNSLIARGQVDRWIDHPFGVIPSQIATLETMAACVRQGWLVVLTGPSMSGKTAAIETLANLHGAAVHKISLHGLTDTSDILGGFEQRDSAASLRDMVEKITHLTHEEARVFDGESSLPELGWVSGSNNISDEKLSSVATTYVQSFATCFPQHPAISQLTSETADSQKGHFHWKDGPLVESMRQGSWFVIENANLCSASVLDRLNSLCDSEGTLTLTERGAVGGKAEVIVPDPRFRLFMTYDPKFGELSRAMRNRGLEISASHLHPEESTVWSWQHHLHLARLARGLGSSDQLPATRPQLYGHDTLLETGLSQLFVLRQHGGNFSNMDISCLHFLARTTPYHLHSQITRLWATHAEMQSQLPAISKILKEISTGGQGALAWQLQTSYNSLAKVRGLTQEVLYRQPLDLSCNPNLTVTRTRGGDLLKNIYNILQVMVGVNELITLSISIKGSQQNLSAPLDLNYLAGGVDQSPAEMLIIEVIETAISELCQYYEASSDLPRAGAEEKPFWGSAVGLVRGLRWLSRNSYRSSMDNICVQNALRYIETCLSNCDHFPLLRKLREALMNSVTPKRGTYMNKIWVAFLESARLISSAALSTNRGANSECRGGETELVYDTKNEHAPIPTSVSPHLLELRVISCNGKSYSEEAEEDRFTCWCYHARSLINGSNIIGTGTNQSCSLHSKTGSKLLHDTTFADILQWQRRVWEMPSLVSGALNGPARLLQASELDVFLSRCVVNEAKLGDHLAFERLLSDEVRAARMSTQLATVSRVDQLKSAFGIIKAVLRESVLNAENVPGRNNSEKDAKVAVAIEKCAFDKYGTCWVDLGKLILELYVPDIPLDPYQARISAASFWNDEVHRIEGQQALLSVWTSLNSGPDSSQPYLISKNEYDDVNQQVTSQEHLLSDGDISRDPSRLRALYAEMWQFLSGVLNNDRLSGLDNDIRSQKVLGFGREQSLQDNVTSFILRLESTYPSFRDIVAPVELACYCIKSGIRFMSQASRSEMSLPINLIHYLEDLSAYPSIQSSVSLQKGSLAVLVVSGFTDAERCRAAALRFSAAMVELEMGIPACQRMDVIQESCEFLYLQWRRDRNKEENATNAANSLFRSRGDQDTPEAEDDEFRTMFPSYDNEDEDDVVISPRFIDSTSEMQRQICQMLYEGFTSPYSKSYKQSTALQHFRDMRTAATTAALFTWAVHGITCQIDESNIMMRVSLLHDRLSQSWISHRPYDFYNDRNTSEAIKASEVVRLLDMRLAHLALQWPDQLVLHDLRVRCGKILSLGLNCSINHILCALENLHLHSADWENFAGRDTTIKSHQDSIASLIVHWRRLELGCWNDLLAIQLYDASVSVSEWWYPLYEIIIHQALKSRESALADFDKYLVELVPLLESFLNSSPIGQFSGRLCLLRAFGNYLDLLACDSTQHAGYCLQRASHILLMLHSHYSYIECTVQAHINTNRASLEAEVKSYIKIASWKDINVVALRESARRSHRQLHKCIRKFRQSLSQTVHSCIKSSEDSSGTRETPHQLKDSEMAYRLNGEDSSEDFLFLRFRSLITGTAIPILLNPRPVEAFRDLVDLIVNTSKHLATVAPNGIATPEGKMAKALLSQKRRSWGDLLKELKRLGLKSSLKPDKRRNILSRQWMLEQPCLSQTEIGGCATIEKYFHRLLDGIWELDSSILPQHHADLTTRELQRASSFQLNLFDLALSSRSKLSSTMAATTKLKALYDRLAQVRKSPEVTVVGHQVKHKLSVLYTAVLNTKHALEETVESIRQLKSIDNREFSSDVDLIEILETAAGQMKESSERLRDLSIATCTTSTHFLTEYECRIVDQEIKLLKSVENLIFEKRDCDTRIARLHIAVTSWSVHTDTMHEAAKPSLQVPSTNAVVKTMLQVVTQGLISLGANWSYQNGEDDNSVLEDDSFSRLHDNFAKVLETLTLDLFVSEVDSLVTSVVAHDSPVQLGQLIEITPYLGTLLSLLHRLIPLHIHWTAVNFKFAYVIYKIVRDLALNGFCKPPDNQSSGDLDSGGSLDQTQDGTGVGDGQGDQNNDEGIENPSQVEGLQGEETDEQPNDKPGNDQNSIEVDDVHGEGVGDVEDQGDANGASDDDEADGLDDTLQKLDPRDPNAVDEKLWAGDGKNEVDEGSEQANKPAEPNAANPPSTVAAGESIKQTASDPAAPDNVTEEAPLQSNENEEQVPPEASREGGMLENNVPTAEILDLPDDLDIADDAQSDIGDISSDSDAKGEDIPPEHHENWMDSSDTKDGPEADMDPEGGLLKETSNENVTDSPDLNSAGGDIGGEADEERSRDNVPTDNRNPNGESGQSIPSRQDFTPAGTDGTNADMPQLDIGPEIPDKGIKEGGDSSKAPYDGSHERGSDERAAKLTSEKLLGNSVDGAVTVSQDIQSGDPGDRETQINDTPGPQNPALEYLHPDDLDVDMQALGPSDVPITMKQSDLESMYMDIDTTMSKEDSPSRSNKQSALQSVVAQTDDQQNSSNNVEAALMVQQSASKISEIRRHSQDDLHESQETPAELANTIHGSLQMQVEGQGTKEAEDLWQFYETQTRDLAYALCEQLRLVLEPTMSTRLRGDYRTGKRLNMKKIIPYIASDFTKDKIWLRRTKPSRREYQVLVSLDDSSSMADSKCVSLAFRTLALVSMALNKLEVGDIAIARFGKSMKLVHDFNSGTFGSSAGAKIISSFCFNQDATNVLELLRGSLEVLSDARSRRPASSAAARDLWQLEIIISDGICQDHEGLKALLRRAEEEHIMIVFIILDQCNKSDGTQSDKTPHESILSMTKVAYKEMAGRIELDLRRYLDTFPFEYYVILRDVSALPEVLSSTLRQFFERLAEE